jgi:hypothetical protein
MLLQVAHQVRGFVRSDAARNADCDLHEYRLQGTERRVQGDRRSGQRSTRRP